MAQLDNYTRFFGNFCNADHNLEEIKYYHSELELLIGQQKNMLMLIEVDLESNPDLYNKKFHFEHTISQNLRNSVIVRLVTFLEIEVQSFCVNLQSAYSLEVNYKDFKGTILEQFEIYTNKICSLEIDFSSSVYETIKEIIELRNCIVHYDRRIEDFYDKKFNKVELIQSISRKIPSVTIKDNGFIELDFNACNEIILIVEKFIKMIYSCIREKLPNDQK